MIVAITEHTGLVYAPLFPQPLEQFSLFSAVKPPHIIEMIGVVEWVLCGCADQQHFIFVNGAIQYVLRTGGQRFAYQVSNH